MQSTAFALSGGDVGSPSRVPLDSIENISTEVVPGALQARYRQSFLLPSWGAARGQCGGITLVRVEGGRTYLRPAMCDRWGCASCGPRKAVWLRDNVRDSQPVYGLDFFCTTTVRTSSCTAAESYVFASQAWNRLRTGLRRDYGAFSFVKVVEPTKKGYAHHHLLTSLSLETGELSTRWLAATGTSWQVDVQSVASERAANYLAKYCAKQAPMLRQLLGEASPRLNMYSKSRNVHFTDLRQSSEAGWMLYRRPWKEVSRWSSSVLPVSSSREVGMPAMTLEGDLVDELGRGIRRRPGLTKSERDRQEVYSHGH
jgi:hypothetical protein